MRITKKAAGITATAITVAMLAAACGSGDDNGSTTADPTPDATNGADAPQVSGSPIPESGRVGAMENFEVGTPFRATEPITIDMLYRVHANYPIDEFNQDWNIFHGFEEMGVNFTREDVLFADWDTRRNTLVAAGQAPTFLPVVWGGQENPWVPGGTLLPISDFFDYMPNATHYMEAWGVTEEIENRRQENGNIYNLQGFREMPNIESSWLINVDMFEAAGAPTEFATFEDFTEGLKVVQEWGAAQTTPFIEGGQAFQYAYSPRWGDGGSGPLGSAMQIAAPNFGVSGGWDRTVAIFDHDADEFVPRVATEGYRQLVEWFAGLRDAGVLDPEITQSDDAAIAKFLNGASAVIETNPAELANAIQRGAADLGRDINTKMIVVPAGPAGDLIGAGQTGAGFVLNASLADSPYLLATIQFLDWLYFSEEGREFATWGVEGRTFERDADGRRQLLPSLGTPDQTTAVLQQQFGFRDGVWMQAWGGSNELLQSTFAPEVAEWHQGMAERKTALPIAPPAPLSESETEQINLIQETVQSGTETGVAQFVSGARSLDEWDAFVEEMVSVGAQQIADIQNEALARARG